MCLIIIFILNTINCVHWFFLISLFSFIIIFNKMHRFGPGRSDWLLSVNITSFWFIFDYIFWRKVQLYEHYQWRIVSLDILWCIKCVRCCVLWIISQHLHVVSNNALSIISNKNSGPFKVHLLSVLKVLLMRLLNVMRSRGRHVGVEEGRTRSISLWVKPWIKRRSLELYELDLACLEWRQKPE